MAPRVVLYMFTGSGPSMTAALMLAHKDIAHKRKHLMVGPHAFGMLSRGFQTMTVPALKIDGRRVQGSRDISRALEELEPQPPLFPGDGERRRAVEHAERFGEELQDIARRLVLGASRRDPRVFTDVYRHASPWMRPMQRVSRAPMVRLATAGHRATDRAASEDLCALPELLDRIDAWIAGGLLDGVQRNAADLQIATAIALLLCFADLAPFIEGRPAARLARLVPEHPDAIASTFPEAWLDALRSTSARRDDSGSVRAAAMDPRV